MRALNLAYAARYADGRAGITGHPQVDSGRGFSCDEQILAFVRAFWAVGMETISSCQSSGPWLIRRRSVSYKHRCHRTLLDAATQIRSRLPHDGWSQVVTVDNYSVPNDIFAEIDWVPSLDADVLRAINGIAIGDARST